MTEQEKQELSNAVAEKYGRDARVSHTYENRYFADGFSQSEEITDITWLHDDSARCFDLMVEHDIDVKHHNNYSVAIWFDSALKMQRNRAAYITDRLTKQEATRIAILRALLAKD